ncbi:MAG: Gfo/Idh/MocA family protein [Vicinamibacteraceae bacterium]
MSDFTRRELLHRAALAAASLSVAGRRLPQGGGRVAPSDQLAIGIIGAGGRGADNLAGVATERIVALCDVDDRQAAKSLARYPDARRYRDFRRMLDAEKGLDAVVVSTPDHVHAAASIAAMRRGLHVYCEKPLTRTIWEARMMRKVAGEAGVVTQMGTQGHALEGSRRAVETIRAGVIGEVTEIHVWTDRPAGWWPQGVDRPRDQPPVPKGLAWDLWLGPAHSRPYHPAYVPFVWRGWYDFGTGAVGDMGVHNLDPAFWALQLGVPVSARLKDSSRRTAEGPPEWEIVELQFPARGDRPSVTVTFYSGKQQPPRDLFQGEPMPTNGSLIIGSKGTLFTRTWHGGQTDEDMFLLLPRKQFVDAEPVPSTLARPPVRGEIGHHQEWIRACKGEGRALSDFAYASTLTEALLVGLLAVRTGRTIDWDAENMRAKGVPEAEPLIKPDFRPGWEVAV